jgi:hypothetical protein
MSWIQLGNDIDGEAGYDYSGFSVSLSSDGSIVAIGALDNGNNGNISGHVRVYLWNGSNWIQRGSNINGEAGGDQSGYSVSLNNDGTVLAIGALYNDGNGTQSGHVRVYSWNGSSWIQRGNDIDGEAAGDYSGRSVSLSSNGTVLAIGEPNNDVNGTQSGHVRVYSWNGSSWIQRGNDIDGEAVGDESGYSVSLNDDGTVLAIGAPLNDGNGNNSGHVRVYFWNGSSWIQRGSDIDGEAGYDESGFSVSLSSDGSIVAIGEPNNDVNGTQSGHVRVYSWSETTTTTTTAAPNYHPPQQPSSSCNNKQYSTIQIRRGSSTAFSSSNPVLASGEPAFTLDTKVFKIGDGTTPWNDLSSIGGSGLSNAVDDFNAAVSGVVINILSQLNILGY